jgi:arylformamidase
MSNTSMTPAEFEAAYDQSKWAPNMEDVLVRYRVLSDAMRSATAGPARIAYGTASGEELDLYRAGEERAPVVIFVHGGGWRGGSAKEYGFPAEMLLAAGIHFVALDFSTIADAKGDLSVLVDQVRRAIVWVHRNCDRFSGDAGRLYVVGHSSGGHLAAMALSTRWTDYDLPANPIAGGVLISGIYDLGPLRHTSRSQYVQLDDHIERQLSPLHQTGCITSPLVLAVGSKESPEFHRQMRDYARSATKSGNRVKIVVGETYNHFDIVETLGNPHGLLGRQLLKFINHGDV